MKNSTILLLVTIFLTISCKKVTGNLEVYETVNLRQGEKRLTLSPSDYKAKVKISKKNILKIKIAGKKFKFKIPSNKATALIENGKLSLSSEEIDQDFNLQANVEITGTRSETLYKYVGCSRGFESCTSNGYGHMYCHPYRGRKKIKYHKSYETQKWTFMILDKVSNETVLAKFEATKNNKGKKVIEHESSCH